MPAVFFFLRIEAQEAAADDHRGVDRQAHPFGGLKPNVEIRHAEVAARVRESSAAVAMPMRSIAASNWAERQPNAGRHLGRDLVSLRLQTQVDQCGQ